MVAKAAMALLGNGTEEYLFDNMEQNLSDNFTSISAMFGIVNASGGDLGNLNGGGPPPVPCLRTGAQVLTQLNFYKVRWAFIGKKW